MDVVAAAGAHKLLLLASLFSSPQFDTSNVFFNLRPLATRLGSWDNVYFRSLMMHGPRFENEYAFSIVWAKIVAAISLGNSLESLALTAAVVSLLCHIVNVLLVRAMAEKLFNKKIAKLSAYAYILHPAGIFLVCGYAESACATLTLCGLLLFLYKRRVLAGLAFALATLLRANGLLWAGVLAVDLLSFPFQFKKVVGCVAGGLLTLFSFLLTQYMAYKRHCPGLKWCTLRVPSVYLYVQEHYWNNGFLKYWSMNNVPNFVMATPTLVMLLLSARFLYRKNLKGVALVQLALALGALLFWHVQIITRLSSCTPGPSFYIAHLLEGGGYGRKAAKAFIIYCVVWTAAQAALFGAFLPPA